MIETVVQRWGTLRRWGERLGPYVVLELLLPGGTLFALLLFLYRQRRFRVRSLASRALVAVAASFATPMEQSAVALRACCACAARDPRRSFEWGYR